MRVVIAGGHGKIALLLERLLAGRGDEAVGLIRNPAHAAEGEKAGAEAVLCDLESASAGEVAGRLAGADAVVFAAGAGPGSGVPRKDAVDRGASGLMGGAAGPAAEGSLRGWGRAWTIRRRGGLPDSPAAGRGRPAAPPPPAGSVSRA